MNKMEETSLQRLEKSVNNKELGELGREMLRLSFIFSCFGNMTKERALESLKDLQINVKFGRYGSSIERAAIRFERDKTYDSGTEKPRNFTLYMSIPGTGLIPSPAHFYYPGSWECLDEEFKRDSQLLNELGFKISNGGYDPACDIIF